MQHEYQTAGGLRIIRTRESILYEGALSTLISGLDSRRGAIFSSNYEYPGRYTRWDTGIIDPPLVVTSHSQDVKLTALNARGVVLLAMIAPLFSDVAYLKRGASSPHFLNIRVKKFDQRFSEEERLRRPSVFSVLRLLQGFFFSQEDSHLGLYGAFGYDLAFQLEPVAYQLPRPPEQRDLVLYLPDSIYVVDHYTGQAYRDSYDFFYEGESTQGLARGGEVLPFTPCDKNLVASDHAQGEYAALVEEAKKRFACGDLFEVVPGQNFFEPIRAKPSEISKKLKGINPSPYSFFINLGEEEYLIGASPEMFVRVAGRRVETCPISGTIARGEDAIADSEQIRILLNSEKEEAELTMCSDVDRNDKSRVCEPGSVRVIGRRQIELYARLIHTVDHIEGRLRKDKDALDAFLSHAWAVTVTGAPKLAAMRFIEAHEKSPRAWYGGAVGMVHFNGDLNTGLTLRTVRIQKGVASVRAGATLLYDSDPEAEEAETRLKASALLDALRETCCKQEAFYSKNNIKKGDGVKILLIDHEDSFVHTLAGYFRQTGAEVVTMRAPVTDAVFETVNPSVVVLSPGPGRPKDFNCTAQIESARARGIAIFGVCLGLQALVEAYGGKLAQLPYPKHGKPSRIKILEKEGIFAGLEPELAVGRYHSLYADEAHLPACFRVTARSEDGVIMAIAHKTAPMAAVQFHPESIMSLGRNAGFRIIENVVTQLGALYHLVGK